MERSGKVSRQLQEVKRNVTTWEEWQIAGTRVVGGVFAREVPSDKREILFSNQMVDLNRVQRPKSDET